MNYPRYETYVGDLNVFPSNAVFYEDEAGIMLLEREHITVDNINIKTWCYLVLKYPMDFIGIYTRHFINIMTPVYRNVYIYDIYTNKLLIILISVLIWLVIGLKFLATPEKLNHRHVDLAAMVLPSILQAAGAPEIRFFLPVYLLSYCYIGVGIEYIDLVNSLKKKWLRYTVVSIIVVFTWLAVIGDTLADCRRAGMLINDEGNEYIWEDK